MKKLSLVIAAFAALAVASSSFGLAAPAGLGLDVVEPVLHLTQTLVRGLDRRRGPLQQVVHDVAVVAAERLGDFQVTELSGGDLHTASVIPTPARERA